MEIRKGALWTDKRELLILACLRKDSRRSLTKMSREIKLPVSTIHDKIKNYHTNVIQKTTAILDFRQLGFKTRAEVLLKTRMKEKGPLLDYLKHCKNVNSLSRINNGYDVLAEVIFKDMVELELLMDELAERFDLAKKEIYYVLEDVKREDFFSSPMYLPEV